MDLDYHSSKNGRHLFGIYLACIWIRSDVGEDRRLGRTPRSQAAVFIGDLGSGYVVGLMVRESRFLPARGNVGQGER